MRPRSAWSALLVGAGIVCAVSVRARAEDPPPLQCVVGEAVEKTAWEGMSEIPSGYVKWAGWGDLRVRIDRPEQRLVMQVFTVGTKPCIPAAGKPPLEPQWLPERDVLKVIDTWTALSPTSVVAVDLKQGDAYLTLGIHEDPTKRGGAVLYWRRAKATRLQSELVKGRSVNDGKVILGGWGDGLVPRVVPYAQRKRKETWLVARKGKTVLVVVRLKPSMPGGDPYDRWLVSLDEAALAKAEGEAVLEDVAPTKALEKFVREHQPENWDPQRMVVCLQLDERAFLIRAGRDDDGGQTYEIFEQPAK